MKTGLRNILIAGGIAALSVGTVAGPAQAADYPDCSTHQQGATVSATCAANGTGFLFHVNVYCALGTFFQGTIHKWVYGNDAAGGGLSTATCEEATNDGWHPEFIGVSIIGN